MLEYSNLLPYVQYEQQQLEIQIFTTFTALNVLQLFWKETGGEGEVISHQLNTPTTEACHYTQFSVT
jgi:hypothetical protein